jgi:hypothetical protein
VGSLLEAHDVARKAQDVCPEAGLREDEADDADGEVGRVGGVPDVVEEVAARQRNHADAEHQLDDGVEPHEERPCRFGTELALRTFALTPPNGVLVVPGDLVYPGFRVHKGAPIVSTIRVGQSPNIISYFKHKVNVPLKRAKPAHVSERAVFRTSRQSLELWSGSRATTRRAA